MYVALGTVRRKGRLVGTVRVDDGPAPRTPQPLRIEVLGNPDSGMQGSAEVSLEDPSGRDLVQAVALSCPMVSGSSHRVMV
jgi:hypothetical protein